MIISDRLSQRISRVLIDNEVINEDESPFYKYVLEYILDLLILNSSLIILSIILKELILGLIYITVMTTVRMFAGGMHANRRFTCSIVSYLMFLICTLPAHLEMITISPSYSLPILIILSITVLYLAPAGNKFQSLPVSQIKGYKLRCFFSMILVSIIYITCVICNYKGGYVVILLCLITIACNQIMAKMIKRTK